jgi:hypothetical protein
VPVSHAVELTFTRHTHRTAAVLDESVGLEGHPYRWQGINQPQVLVWQLPRGSCGPKNIRLEDCTAQDQEFLTMHSCNSHVWRYYTDASCVHGNTTAVG